MVVLALNGVGGATNNPCNLLEYFPAFFVFTCSLKYTLHLSSTQILINGVYFI